MASTDCSYYVLFIEAAETRRRGRDVAFASDANVRFAAGRRPLRTRRSFCRIGSAAAPAAGFLRSAIVVGPPRGRAQQRTLGAIRPADRRGGEGRRVRLRRAGARSRRPGAGGDRRGAAAISRSAAARKGRAGGRRLVAIGGGTGGKRPPQGRLGSGQASAL